MAMPRTSIVLLGPGAGISECAIQGRVREELEMLGKRGSMMLFLRGLPENLTRKELKAFVKSAIKSTNNRSFSFKATVRTCTVLRITDQSDGTHEYHGLVEVQPAKAAMQAIEVLNGKELKGARIEARRYHHRTPLRDRRRNTTAYERSENRQRERRRRNIKIDLVGV